MGEQQATKQSAHDKGRKQQRDAEIAAATPHKVGHEPRDQILRTIEKDDIDADGTQGCDHKGQEQDHGASNRDGPW